MDLNGKAAIVTGGGTGVGRATVLQLAQRGCGVVVNYSRSRDEAEQTAADARACGVEAVAVQADVAEDAACRRLVAGARRVLGRLDVLVNNAATTRFIELSDLEAVTEEDWSRIFRVNVQGAFQMARAARGLMVESGGGQIINVSSIAALRGKGSSLPYCASKAALNNLTIALARVLAPKIRVNAVAPGFITGRWLEEGLGAHYEGALRQVQQQLPLGRVNEPQDIAAAILGLVTGSELVTGQVLVVDGGMMISG
jgi:3-oxoacyl-[acyl-carrier protein] reductase